MKAQLFTCAAALALAGCGYTTPNNVNQNEYYSDYEWLQYCTPYQLTEGQCSDHSIGAAKKAGYHSHYVAASQYDHDRAQYGRKARKATRR